jgi:hypothetical protein
VVHLFEHFQRILEAKDAADGFATALTAAGNVVFKLLFVQPMHASYSFHVLNNGHTPVAARTTEFLVGFFEENQNPAHVLSIIVLIFFVSLSAVKECIG